MRAVIICGGTIKNYRYIKGQIKDNDTIICADSGYDHAVNMGLGISIVVGDFDSINTIPTDIQTIQYPARKDQTDSEIAMDYARKMGFKDFLLIAATGTRLDHALTNILLLKDCLGRGENAVIVDENNKIMITDSTVHLQEPSGSIVSLVPLSECHGVTTDNLEYPLCDATLYMGKGHGVSNIMVENNALVSIQKGLLLVIIAKD